MTLADRVASGVKATLLARVVSVAANAVLLLALTRYLLTPAEYGRLYFAISVLGVAVLFGTLGVPKATARYVAEYGETDPGQVPHLLERSLAVALALAAVVAVVLALVGGRLAALLGSPDLAPFLALGALLVAGKALHVYLKTVFQGFNSVQWSAVIGGVNGTARLAVAVGLVLLGFGALGALGGYVAGYLLAAVVGLAILYLRFYRGHERDASIEPGLLRRVLEYSVPTTATRASVVIDSRIDSVLLGVLAGPVAVGFYTLARQIADVCIVPAQALGFTITPTFGEQAAADRRDRAARLYERAVENVLLLYVPAGAGIALVAEPGIRYVFGADYLGAVPVVQLFAVFVLVRAIHKITGSGLDYLGLARVRATARGASALGNVGLNLLLIPRYGALGAGVATVITYTLYTLVNVYYVHRAFDLRVTFLATRGVQTLAIAGVMAGGVALAVPHVAGLPSLLGAIALGGVLWATMAVGSGLVDVAEVRSFLG